MYGLRRSSIRCSLLLPLLLSLYASPALAQTGDAPADELVASIQRTAVRALSFTQGDRSSLTDVRDEFTETAWSEFMGGLKEWLNGDGTPAFSSSFTPSGPALDVSSVDGSVRLTIPGVLVQRSRNAAGGGSTTSYRAEIDVEAIASPLKIRHLEQRTCGGASSVASCR